MRVWIDQDLCTGDALCADACPDIFCMAEDGLAYVKEADWPTLAGPAGTSTPEPKLQGADGMAFVPEQLIQAVIDSAEDCPCECIFIEM